MLCRGFFGSLTPCELPRTSCYWDLGKSVYVLLSGLFCCLRFSGVMCFSCLGGGVLFFLLFGRGPRPSPNSKKNTPCPNSKKTNTPPPLPSVLFFFFCLGGWSLFFVAVWAGGVFFFLLFGRGACSFFCCLGRGRVLFFFAVWAGGVFFFLLFGRGSCFFLLFGPGTFFFFFCCLGAGQELTHLPVCLARPLSDPETKKTKHKQKKNKTRVPFG